MSEYRCPSDDELQEKIDKQLSPEEEFEEANKNYEATRIVRGDKEC